MSTCNLMATWNEKPTQKHIFAHDLFAKKNNYVCVVAGEAHTKFMPKVDHSAHRQKVQTLKGYKSSCNYAEQLFKKWKLLLFNYTFNDHLHSKEIQKEALTAALFSPKV